MLTMVVILWTATLVVGGMQTVESSVYKKVYRRYDEEKDWEGARKHCLDEQGDLATIKSPEEDADVKESVSGATETDYWLGLWKRPSSANNYTWIDGSFEWGTLTKSKHLDSEHCVRLQNGNSWNNANCDLDYRFICQFYQAINCSTLEDTTQDHEQPTTQGVSTKVGTTAELSTITSTPDEQRHIENKDTTVSLSDDANLYSTKGSKIPEIDLDDADYKEDEKSESDMKSSDYRTSAKAIGGTSIIFIAFFFGVIIVIDLDTFAKNLKQLKRNLSR